MLAGLGGQHPTGRAYSLDLRERVVAAVAAGESCRSVAATFKVSVASVVKWSQRFRTTGSAVARPMGGSRPYVLSSGRDWLLTRLAEQPDITLRALLAELAERGIKVSYYAVWHFFEHEGISFKKACTPASRIVPTSPGDGRNGKSIKGGLILSRLVFIDETWAKTQYDARPWPRSTRRAAGRQGSTWAAGGR
jgi:transposase